MAKTTLIVTGDKRLNRKLAKLKGPEGKKVIRKASRAAMKVYQFAAKQNAPSRTGTLKKQIKVRAMKRSRVKVGTMVRATGDGFYGNFLELGTRHIDAMNFMRMAAKDNQSRILAIYRRDLGREITALARRG